MISKDYGEMVCSFFKQICGRTCFVYWEGDYCSHFSSTCHFKLRAMNFDSFVVHNGVGISDWLSSFIVCKGLEWERRDEEREDMVIVVNMRWRERRHGYSGKQEINRSKTWSGQGTTDPQKQDVSFFCSLMHYVDCLSKRNCCGFNPNTYTITRRIIKKNIQRKPRTKIDDVPIWYFHSSVPIFHYTPDWIEVPCIC